MTAASGSIGNSIAKRVPGISCAMPQLASGSPPERTGVASSSKAAVSSAGRYGAHFSPGFSASSAASAASSAGYATAMKRTGSQKVWL